MGSSSSSSSSSGYHDSHVVELVGKILIVSIVVLSVIIISVFFLHLYAKWFWYPRLRLRLRRPQQQDSLNTRRHRRGDGHQSGVTVLRRGLSPSFLKTIPVISFDPKDFKDGLECTVCLSEVCQGEETRILPKCCHGFHVECIDMWFHSHSTCPICRGPVSDETAISVENLLETQQQSSSSSTDSGVGSYFPSNILFWGDETEVITLTSQLEEANSPSSSSYANNTPARPDLVIDIPTQSDDDNDDDVEDQKSPVSTSSRMRSLTRILSGSRRFINPFGSVTPNIEQRTRAHL